MIKYAFNRANITTMKGIINDSGGGKNKGTKIEKRPVFPAFEC